MSRRRCGSSRRTAARSVVLTLGPPEAEEQLRDVMAIGADRAILLETDGAGVGRAGDRRRDRRGDRAPTEPLRPDRLRQRVGRRRQLPGRDPRRVRARAAGRDRAQGAHDRGRPRPLRAGRGDGRDVYDVPLPAVVTVKEGLNLPRYPSVPGRLRAKSKPLQRSAPYAARAGAREGAPRPPAGPGQAGRDARHGAEAAPAVVEMLAGVGSRDESPSRRHGRRARRALAAGPDARAVLRDEVGRSAAATLAGASLATCERRRTRPRPLGCGGRRRRPRCAMRSSLPARTAATRCSRTSRRGSTCRSRRTARGRRATWSRRAALGREPARGGATRTDRR